MGLRGIDIQVAIQRAAEADKLQQGATSQLRAGEAALREEAELERLRRQQQPKQAEKGDQVIVQHRKEQNRSGSGERGEREESTDGVEGSEEEVKRKEGAYRDMQREGHLDILA